MAKVSSVSMTDTRREVNGVILHCVEAGPEDGPLIFLLHGFPEFWWGWRKQIEPLAQAGFRVVVPDQRGYNLSNKPQGKEAYAIDILARDIVGLAEAYGRKTFSVVGHDWGGLVAWWIAASYPNRVERLVAINAPHPGVFKAYGKAHPGQMLKSLYVGFFQFPALPEAMLSAQRFRALKASLTRSSRPGTFSEADLAAYEEAWAQQGALTAMLNWYRALPLLAPLPEKGHLPMPVLVLWGMRDQFLQPGLVDASLARCDWGQGRMFKTATHWVHLEEPEAINQELIGFMTKD